MLYSVARESRRADKLRLGSLLAAHEGAGGCSGTIIKIACLRGDPPGGGKPVAGLGKKWENAADARG